MEKIAYVRVYLDDDVPEDMEGIIRCGSVILEDEDGNELKDHQELIDVIIDNSEFHSQEALIKYVAGKLGVDIAIVGIEA